MKILKGHVLGVVLAALVGCVPMVEEPTPEPEAPKFMTHTIRYPGETLAALAQWYYGSTTSWTRIEAANPGVRPDRLRLGQELQLPLEGMVRTTAFPAPERRRPTPSVVTGAESDEPPEPIATRSVSAMQQHAEKGLEPADSEPTPPLPTSSAEPPLDSTASDAAAAPSLSAESDDRGDDGEASALTDTGSLVEVSPQPEEQGQPIEEPVPAEERTEQDEARERLWEQLLRLGNPE